MARKRRGAEADEPTDADRRRMGQPVPRQLYRSGGSLVVAVPSDVAQYLDARVGQRMWWFLGASREAIISMSPRRVGGRPGGMHAGRELTVARAEITRLQRRLAARPDAVYNEGVNEGRMRHMGELAKLGAQLDELTKRVEELTASIPFRRRRGRVFVAGSSSTTAPPRPVEEIPLPDLPSPSAVVERGADTSGAQPPGVPQES